MVRLEQAYRKFRLPALDPGIDSFSKDEHETWDAPISALLCQARYQQLESNPVLEHMPGIPDKKTYGQNVLYLRLENLQPARFSHNFEIPYELQARRKGHGSYGRTVTRPSYRCLREACVHPKRGPDVFEIGGGLS